MRPQAFRAPSLDAPKGRVEEVILRCDTLWINTDRGLLTLTWRGLIDAPRGLSSVGTIIVDAEPGGAKLRWEDIASRLADACHPLSRGALSKAPCEAAPDPLSVRYDGVLRENVKAAAVEEATLDEPTVSQGRAEPRPAAPEPASKPAVRPLVARPKPGQAPVPAPRKELGIERYGTACAELAQKGVERAAVLGAHRLTEPGFKLLEAHWKKALAREAEAGGTALLLAFDQAYLAAQQRLGQPVGAREYARIQVAIERGEVGAVLAELSWSWPIWCG